jgi:hypothetical protein
MARVRLEGWNGQVVDVPPVCVQCGAPATTFPEREFSWHPRWLYFLLLLGLIPAAVAVLILTKKMRMAVPFCAAHAGHWNSRLLVIIGGVVGFPVLFILIFSTAKAGPGPGISLQEVLLGMTCLAVVGWIGLIIILAATEIRPREITDTSITLLGVSPLFVEAVEDQASARPDRLDLDRDVHDHWKGRERRAEDVGRFTDADAPEPPQEPEDRYRGDQQ